MKKVLIIVGNLGRGGAEKQLLLLLSSLKFDQCKILLINLSRERQEYWSAAAAELPLEYMSLYKVRTQLGRVLSILQAAFRFKPNFIWGWHFFTGIYGIIPSYLMPRCKLVVGLRNDAHYLRNVHPWANLLLRVSDAVVANSTAVLTQLEEVLGRKSASYYLPNIVEMPPSREVRKPNVSVIGSCGNIHPRKGFDVFIAAVKILVEKYDYNGEVLIGGTGDAQVLKSMSKDLGLSNVVRFISDPNCADLIKCFDIFVLPSRHEGCPNVLLEAMASGIPCIATDVGGVSEILTDGDNGILVSSESPDEIAEACAQLIDDFDKREVLSKYGRDSIAERREPSMVANLVFLRILDDINLN